MTIIEIGVATTANWIWGLPLTLLVTLSGTYFILRTRFATLRKIPHAVGVLTGKYDQPDAPGQINHFRALSVAMASTIGMGNIAGVAIAISIGGPGAIFWMWVSAILGMATKFVTCTLAVMYRGYDRNGTLQGGPMYVIREGLGRRWTPLAWLFCAAGMIGCLPIFNANQLASASQSVILTPHGVEQTPQSLAALGFGLFTITSIVVLGGLTRIANMAASLVCLMIAVYFIAVSGILIKYADQLPYYFTLIFSDAFSADFYKGEPLFGGVLGGLILLGVRRAAFSNEAGLGTAPMAHGAAKTDEPIHEGLVGMLGPVIDTLLICTLTAMAILVTGVWTDVDGMQGVELTLQAFRTAYPTFGAAVLIICILCFGISSLFSYAYYGQKCCAFLFNTKNVQPYTLIYLFSILLGAVLTIDFVVNLIDIAFALMAIPTLTSAIILSPEVFARSKRYFKNQTFSNMSL
jgi:AGCS family alanine or glycine:cation symporter